jgi:hypothetical protein
VLHELRKNSLVDHCLRPPRPRLNQPQPVNQRNTPASAACTLRAQQRSGLAANSGRERKWTTRGPPSPANKPECVQLLRGTPSARAKASSQLWRLMHLPGAASRLLPLHARWRAAQLAGAARIFRGHLHARSCTPPSRGPAVDTPPQVPAGKHAWNVGRGHQAAMPHQFNLLLLKIQIQKIPEIPVAEPRAMTICFERRGACAVRASSGGAPR